MGVWQVEGATRDFGVLGPLEVAVGGRAVTVGSAQVRMLLAALVVQRGGWWPRIGWSRCCGETRSRPERGAG